MKFYKMTLAAAALCSIPAFAAYDVATSGSDVPVQAQSGYRCVVSVQNLYKELTPAGSGEMPVIPLAQAKRNPGCPHVTADIEAAYKKRASESGRVQVAQMSFGSTTIGGTTIGGVQYPGGYSAGGVTVGGTTIHTDGSMSVGGVSVGGTSMGGMTVGGTSIGGINIHRPR
jgi:hypothetical protein